MSETEVLKKEDEDDFEVIEETEEEASSAPEQKEEKAPEPEAKAEEPKEEPKKSEEDLSGISDAVKKRIDKLTFKMREAERREQAAIEYAKSLQVENQSFKQKAHQLDQSLVVEYEGRVKAQQQVVTDKLKAAVESGDVDGQIEAQKQLAALALEEDKLRTAKQQRATQPQPQAQPQTPQPQPQYQQPQAARPDPRAEAWAERNEWFGADQAMTATAFVIHKMLVEEEGFDPSGEDYYSELDRRIRGEFPHKFRKEQPVERPAPAAVASARPTARSESNPKQVKLSRSQIEIARKLGVSVKDYARQLQKLAR
jgi:hypothetical protein